MGEALLEAFAGFLAGGASPCPLAGGARSRTSSGQSYVKGVCLEVVVGSGSL